MALTIWLDGDGAPGGCKDILFRVANKRQVLVVVVANRWQRLPRSPWIKLVQVSAGMDVADDHIVASCVAGDIVVTTDVPLAAEAIEKGAIVIEHRGGLLTEDNIGQRLGDRDFMTEIRASGLGGGGGPPPYGPKDKARFSNTLDRLLTKAGA